jgi:hypothetical protein
MFELFTGFDWERQPFALGFWERPSQAVIEVTVLAIAVFLVRNAINSDRRRNKQLARLKKDLKKDRRRGKGHRRHRHALRPYEVGSSDDSHGRRPRLTSIIRAAVFTFALEALLLSQVATRYVAPTGADRNPYEYPETFLISIYEVPIWIPIGWGVIFYLAMLTSDRLICSPRRLVSGLISGPDKRPNFGIWRRAALARAVMDASLALTIDLALDPIAQAEGWWTWTPRLQTTEFFAIPVSNFVGWFAIIFSLSLLIRTGRLFLGGAQLGRTRSDRWLFDAGFLVVTFTVSFFIVAVLVRLIYGLDEAAGRFSSAALFGLLVVVAIAIVSSSALPLQRRTRYDKSVARSVIALHAAFIAALLLNLFSGHDNPVYLIQAPHAETVYETEASKIVKLDLRAELADKSIIQFDVTGVIDTEFVVADEVPILISDNQVTETKTKAVDIAISRNADVLPTRDLINQDPEVAIWLPSIASISLLLFILPYWDDLSKRFFSTNPKRRQYWWFEL